MRFGPLNNEGGENRLNVAVTRAKEKVYLVSSIHPNQISVENAKNLGPKLLKEYLQYAWSISQGTWRPMVSDTTNRSATWYLREKIADKSFHEFNRVELKKTFDFSDLTVVQEKEETGLILTDADIFFNAISAKEAFVYYPNQLSDKRWPNTRFYSRVFWIDKQTIKERLKIFLNRTTDQ